jgi:hypothetical protein
MTYGKKVGALYRKIWHHLPFGFFAISVLCLCFTYGFMVGNWHLFPYRFLKIGWDSLKELRNKRPHQFHPARYEGEGVIVYKPEQVFPGIMLITGSWKNKDDWNMGIRLIRLDGEVLHEWQTNPENIWKKSPYHDYAARSIKTETNVHGAILLPNGDIVFNLEYLGLIRMNSNSEVVWKLPYRTHHSVFQDDGGKLWVCGTKWHENRIQEFPDLRPPFMEDTILKVSPEGVIEREISLLDVIYKSGYDGLLRLYSGDVLHLNDIELLNKNQADAFKDLFQVGDILVSLRHLNTVCVIDGRTEQIKWSLTHPFIGQHDPDFTEDGYITVFDNHSDWLGDRYEERGSRIIRIEPSTKKVVTLYGWKENQYFYTTVGGKHQHLPNGNMIITEATPGRVFEINPDGEIVWDWIVERWNKDYVPEIMQGIRYGSEYADFVRGLRKDEK